MKKNITNRDLIAHFKFMNNVFSILAGEYSHDETNQVPTTNELLFANYCNGFADAYHEMCRLMYDLSVSDNFSFNEEAVTDDFNHIMPKKITLQDVERTLNNLSSEKDNTVD